MRTQAHNQTANLREESYLEKNSLQTAFKMVHEEIGKVIEELWNETCYGMKHVIHYNKCLLRLCPHVAFSYRAAVVHLSYKSVQVRPAHLGL